jgi:hypothetical protein
MRGLLKRSVGETVGCRTTFDSAPVPIRHSRRRARTPPQFAEIEYEIRVVTDESRRRVELLHHNLSRYGTVYNTLAAVCDTHGRIVAIPPRTD